MDWFQWKGYSAKTRARKFGTRKPEATIKLSYKLIREAESPNPISPLFSIPGREFVLQIVLKPWNIRAIRGNSLTAKIAKTAEQAPFSTGVPVETCSPAPAIIKHL